MSETPKKFPFLRLPLLAIQQVVSKMELQAMFYLSVTSTKAKNALRISLPKNYFYMECAFWSDTRITLEVPSHESIRLCLNPPWAREDAEIFFKIQNVEFRCSQQNMTLKYGGILEEGTKALLTHLAETFNLPKISMHILNEIQPNVASTLLKHVKILNLPLVKVSLATERPSLEVYREFLNEGPRISQELTMRCEYARDFSFSPESRNDFKMELFLVRDGHWVHLEDYMECRRVEVYNATLNPKMYCLNAQRLNAFLKLWKGSECRLEYLSVNFGLSVSRPRIVLDGAGDIPQADRLNFEQMTAGLDGTNFTKTHFFQSLDIERLDGKRARIKLSQRSFDFVCY